MKSIFTKKKNKMINRILKKKLSITCLLCFHVGCDASLNTTELNQVYHHDTWLQDDVIELDLEAELLTSTFNRCRNSSNHSSSSEIDASSLYNKIRLPPSGRSSAMSTSILQESAGKLSQYRVPKA